MAILNALTIDLEDWYQGLTSTSQQVARWPEFEDRVVDSTNLLLSILQRADVRATFFVLGYVADQFPELIRRVADLGHEIGLHGYYHRFVHQLSVDELKIDVVRGREAVEKSSGRHVIGYRAPYFSINHRSLWALKLINDLGFQYDSSVFPTRNMLYGYPGAPRLPYFPFDNEELVEFPPSTIRILGMNLPIAGGFYLRLTPCGLFKKGLTQLNRQGQPAILYLHPWELDPNQPIPNPTTRERFTHYYGLKSMAAKLVSLLSDFRFSPLSNLLDQFRTRLPETT